MQTKSAKAKGRKLQNWVCKYIRWVVKSKNRLVDTETIRPALMGETGADIKIPGVLANFFPFRVECKNAEGFKNVYKAFDQACNHSAIGGTKPLLFLKINRRRPLVIMDAEEFFEEFFNVRQDDNPASE